MKIRTGLPLMFNGFMYSEEQWKPVDPLLGNMSDVAVSKLPNVPMKESAILRRRRKLGIAPYVLSAVRRKFVMPHIEVQAYLTSWFKLRPPGLDEHLEEIRG